MNAQAQDSMAAVTGGSVVYFTKGSQVVKIKPAGERFLVCGKRAYLNDSPDVVMVMAMLMRRGFEEVESRESVCVG